ncbi:RidA family protein [Synechocystis sp. CACIAM 05]|uniref:RidA family protein n=1 Tax=Synechocystis sp. CACIAM 05 TaxID=1933929 RepID=UPI00138E8D6B|nr:RidA family protein [Synechocystis sp. CACIAM 05]QHV01616.1 reactive intermediate/imine deaminase [Synechocystis sp. CACIAM 05]
MQIINTAQAPAPVGPYNQAIAANGFLFTAGQIALDPQTMTIVGEGNVEAQAKQVLTNLGAVLQEAGCGWENVVKTTVFLKDMNDFAAVNAIYGQYFDEATAPARSCVEVARLPKDVLVEIDCVAVLPT